MNVDYLKEFTELAKHMSFTEAARLLNMSQPTLSKHIRSLEAHLGMMLFDRTGARLKLTERGSALLPFAYRVLDAQNDFDRAVKDLRKTPPPHLTVYGISDEEPSTEVLGFLVSLLGKRYGTGFLEVKSTRDIPPEELLEKGLADFVLDSGDMQSFAAGQANEGGNRAALLGKLPLVAFVDRKHPLAGSARQSIKAFHSSDLLKFEGIYLERSWCHIENACLRHGFTPKVRSFHCANAAELLASCANLGTSVLLVGRNFADRIPRGIRPLCSRIDITDPDVSVPLYFLYRADNQNPLVRETVAYLETNPSPGFEFAKTEG